MSVELSSLANGMRVVTEEMPHLATSSVGVWVNAGARNESKAENGLSHMLEHMAFKGTERRSALSIAVEIEKVGGSVNAYTSRENTAYFARVLEEDVPLAVDILGDILQHSTFEEAELEREREVIVQEIGLTLDTPDDIVFDHFQETAFPDQAVGRSILGPAENVRGFTSDHLRQYMARHYHAPNLVLVATGAVRHDEVLALAEEHFGGLSAEAAAPFDDATYRGGDWREDRELEQAHVLMGVEGIPYDHPDYYAHQVMNVVLGGGMSSRLFQEVREKRGLAYSVYSFASSFTDSGIFGMYAGTGADALAELPAVLMGQLEDLAVDAGEEETARARAQIKAGILMSLESSASRCEQLARQLQVWNRILTVEEVIAEVENVDGGAVRLAAEAMRNRASGTLAAIGPIARLENDAAIAARFAP